MEKFGKTRLISVAKQQQEVRVNLGVVRFDREGHSHVFTLDARYVEIGVTQTAVEYLAGLGGVGLQRGGICHYPRPCHCLRFVFI